jgi:hypothetical protein
MTQLFLPAEPRFARPKAAPAGRQLARLKERLRAAGRGFDLVDLGVTLWLTLWAACVSASLMLLLR